MRHMRSLLLAAALVAAAVPGRALAGHAGPNYCGVDIPPDEALGTVALPQGDVFCPLLADPKSSGSFVSWERVRSDTTFGNDIGSVGIADRFGLVRWGGPQAGDGLEISVEDRHLDEALRELVVQGGELTKSLLGFRSGTSPVEQ